MKKSFNFSIRVLIFIFFLIINQEQKASSIDTGSGLHFISAISSDPKMQELIIKSVFYTGAFLSYSISALIITALTKYIFFQKNEEKVKKDDSGLLQKISNLEEKYSNAVIEFQKNNKELITQLCSNQKQSIEVIEKSNQYIIDQTKKIHEEKIQQLNLKYQEELQCIQDELKKDKTQSSQEKSQLLLEFDNKIKQIGEEFQSKEESMNKAIQRCEDIIDRIDKKSETIEAVLTKEREELKTKLNEAQKNQEEKIKELLEQSAVFSENIHCEVEQFQENTRENQTNLLQQFENKLEVQVRQNQELIKNIKTGYEDQISQLKKAYQENIEKLVHSHDVKIKELSEEQKKVLAVQKELLELKKKEDARQSEEHEWEKNDREEKITAEKAKKEFLTNNSDDIQKMIKKLEEDLQKIDFTNTDSGLESYKTVQTKFPNWELEDSTDRQNTIMVYAMKGITFKNNMQNEEVKKETAPIPDQCHEYLLSQAQIKSLVGNFIKRFDEMKAFEEQHPEVNELYQKNKNKIQDCLDKIESLITNLDSEKIKKEHNDYFEKISKSATIKDLFINAVSTFKIEFENTVDAEGVFPFLSKEDRKKLESALKSITSENEKRGKDLIRQYRWFENDNADMMKDVRAEIQKIVKKIQDGKDYTVYEKYSDLSTYGNACSLVLEYKEINDQNREIVNIVLQKEYNDFKAALEKEKKERDKNPHRCSLYEKNKDNINAYVDNLQKIVISIKQQDVNKITEDQNKEYVKLIENINFEIDYNQRSFIDSTLSNLDIKLTKIDNLLDFLNKEEKKSIKDCYVALKKEYILRKNNPAREYQWYIDSNEDAVRGLVKLIEDLTTRIKENGQDDNTYEIYQDVLGGDLDNQSQRF